MGIDAPFAETQIQVAPDRSSIPPNTARLQYQAGIPGRRHNVRVGLATAATSLLRDTPQVLLALPAAESQLGKVKITAIKTAPVHTKHPAHLLRVEIDSGLYGLGKSLG